MKIERLGMPVAPNISSAQKPNKTSGQPQGGGFANVLKESVAKVNALQTEADAAINDLVLGDSKDVVQTMIMVEKADVSFRLMMQVRNKIIQAYEEVMRTQV